jgi:hypothetical protein
MTDVMKNQKKVRNIFTKKDRSEKKESLLNTMMGSFTALSVEYLYLTDHSNK